MALTHAPVNVVLLSCVSVPENRSTRFTRRRLGLSRQFEPRAPGTVWSSPTKTKRPCGSLATTAGPFAVLNGEPGTGARLPSARLTLNPAIDPPLFCSEPLLATYTNVTAPLGVGDGVGEGVGV